MKKKFFLTLLFLLPLASVLSAQTMQTEAPRPAKYGYVSYNRLLVSLPEYVKAQQQLSDLKQKYENEARYNEESFKRQFAEFLQGQKDFPQTILLKRQRDLQDAMERGMAYRESADSLLRQAEKDLCAPARLILDAALRAVGTERGYDYIIDTDAHAYPYLNPALAEDATPYVRQKLEASEP